MKIAERLSIVLLLMTGICFVMFYWKKMDNMDIINPEITCNTLELFVSVDVTEEELLAGVTAWDDTDGDITDQVMIASYSKFIDPKEAIRNVKYIVFDSHYNVSQITRTISYTDYESPHFYLKKPLRFPVNNTINLYECIGAMDCLDGDISDKIKVIYNDAGIINNTPGEYEIEFQISNSAGDVSYLKVNVEIFQGSYYKPEIVLNQYLVYIHQGEAFDPYEYIEQVNSARENEILTVEDVTVHETVDTSVPGTYEVRYSVVSDNGYEGTNRLVVIVEE